MRSKKASYKQIFDDIKSLSILGLLVMFESRLFVKDLDITELINCVNNSNDFLSDNNSFVIISDLDKMKILFVSEQFTKLTGFPANVCTLTFFIKHYCPADFKQGLDILKAINAHQKSIYNKTDKQHYLYTSTFRFLSSKGQFTWFYNRMVFIVSNNRKIPTIVFHIITDIEGFKKNDNLTHSRLRFNWLAKVYEQEHYEEFLPEGVDLLTQTDLKILGLLIEGNDNEQIANEMDLSEHTIKSYRKKMLKKTWCDNTTELISFALRNKLI
jgi:DNA-binding CsgD family transcriptional regulator